MSRIIKNLVISYVKTKPQIRCAETAQQVISAFVFASYIVLSLYFLNPKFQASYHLLWLFSQVCVGPRFVWDLVGFSASPLYFICYVQGSTVATLLQQLLTLFSVIHVKRVVYMFYIFKQIFIFLVYECV